MGIFFPIPLRVRGNQHGSREYDDLQNSLDMTSHENNLLLGSIKLNAHYLPSLQGWLRYTSWDCADICKYIWFRFSIILQLQE